MHHTDSSFSATRVPSPSLRTHADPLASLLHLAPFSFPLGHSTSPHLFRIASFHTTILHSYTHRHNILASRLPLLGRILGEFDVLPTFPSSSLPPYTFRLARHTTHIARALFLHAAVPLCISSPHSLGPSAPDPSIIRLNVAADFSSYLQMHSQRLTISLCISSICSSPPRRFESSTASPSPSPSPPLNSLPLPPLAPMLSQRSPFYTLVSFFGITVCHFLTRR